MPKKMTPKPQAKNKTLFLQYPFLAIFSYFFTLKKYHAHIYTIFKF